MFDLLSEAVFQTNIGLLTLPGVLTAFSDGPGIKVYPNMRPHHRQGWECFITQLAAIALHKAGKTKCEPGLVWERLLLDLTNGDRRPWTLVDDPNAPAFFQCPWVEPPVGKEISVFVTPDSYSRSGGCLDLFSAKDELAVKSHQMTQAPVDSWIYTLVTRQTLTGSRGRGWASSSRGGRSYAAVVFRDDPGLTFRTHVDLILGARDEWADRDGFAMSGGKALLWLYPWPADDSPDSASGFIEKDLDPLFIDTARNYRMYIREGQLTAKACNRERPRVKDERRANRNRASVVNGGILSDPWCPLAKRKEGIGTISLYGGSDYWILAGMVAACGRTQSEDGVVIPSLCQQIPPRLMERPDATLVAQGFRVNSTVPFWPFFRRDIPLPVAFQKGTLGHYTKTMLNLVGHPSASGKKGITKALANAARIIRRAGSKKRTPAESEVVPRFHRWIDHEFFDRLAEFIPEGDVPTQDQKDVFRNRCVKWAAGIAETVLNEVLEEYGVPPAQAVSARRTLQFGLKKV